MLRIVVEAIGEDSRNSRSTSAGERPGRTRAQPLRKIWVLSNSASIAVVTYHTDALSHPQLRTIDRREFLQRMHVSVRALLSNHKKS
jgi:hypothetical protein